MFTFHIASPLQPDEVVARLKANTEPDGRARFSSKSDKLFRGTIDGDGFRFFRAADHACLTRVRVTGRIEPRGYGTLASLTFDTLSRPCFPILTIAIVLLMPFGLFLISRSVGLTWSFVLLFVQLACLTCLLVLALGELFVVSRRNATKAKDDLMRLLVWGDAGKPLAKKRKKPPFWRKKSMAADDPAGVDYS